MPKTRRKKIESRPPSHVLYNHVLVHVLTLDMYVGICDSASKEAYMYIISTCVGVRIGGDKLQCNHVHGVRVDDMRAQCRYTMSCSSEYPEKCPDITIIRILVLIFNFFPGGGPPDQPDWGPLRGPRHFQQPMAAPLQICFRRPCFCTYM